MYLFSQSDQRAVLYGLALASAAAGLFCMLSIASPAWVAGVFASLDTRAHRVGSSAARLGLSGLGLLLSMAARAAAGDGPLVIDRLALPLWLAGIALTASGLWPASPAPAEAQPRTVWRPWETGLIVGLVLLAFGLRAWRIGDAPHVLSGDEGSAGLVGWEFTAGTRDNLLSLGWFTFPALYFWLISLVQNLLGRTVEAVRGLSALAGTATVVAAYLAFRPMFGRRIAAWSAAWLATAHAHVLFSRIAYNNIFDPLFLVAAAGLFWQGWQRGDRRHFIAAGLCVGASQFFYTTARLIPLLLLLWIPFLARARPADRARWTGLAAAGLSCLAVVLPLFLLYASHPDLLLFTSSRVSMLIPGWIEPVAEALGTTPAGLILEQMGITLLGLGTAELQGVYANSSAPLLLGASFPLFVAGMVVSCWKLRLPHYVLPWLTLGAVVLVGGLSIEAPSSQRMLLLTPFLGLGIAWGLESAVGLASRWGRSASLAAAIGTTAVLSFAMLENGRHLFLHYLPGGGYGGRNGEVSQAMIDLLSEEAIAPSVYFLGGDRMGYGSIPSVSYLLPHIIGHDVAAPYRLTGDLSCAWVFILPEEQNALPTIEAQTPGGSTGERYNPQGRLIFLLRRSDPAGCQARAQASSFPVLRGKTTI